MKMKYPKYEVYEKIYKRYFEKGVNYFIKEANLNPKDKVLDICGGNGRLTKELKKKVNNVSYLDQEKDMIPKSLKELGVTVYNQSIQDFVSKTNNKYNKVFCEQAINYWLLKIDMNKFSKIIDKEGLFIFNTFSKKPPEKPMIKEYEIDGKSYIEISYLINKKVHHVQIREGFEPHFTAFDWISEEEYTNILSPYFNIKIIDDGKSALYICRRK